MLAKTYVVSRTVVFTLSLLLAQSALTQEGRSGRDDEEAPATGQIDQATGAKLAEAIEFLNNDQNAEARATLADLNFERLSPYERSRVEQILASLDFGDEDYEGARTHFQAALDSGGLNAQEASQISYQIAQIFVSEEKWSEGAAAMEAWIAAAVEPNSAAYYLLAVCYYQQDLYDDALVPARKAVELSSPPQEAWLQLVQALLLQKEDYQGAVVILKQMINLFPDKKPYWTQLSSVYATLEDFKNALIVLQLAYHAGMITEDAEIRRLSDMMMVQDLPFRAASLLSSAVEQKLVQPDMKLYESLANSWIAAREYQKSLPALESAADLAENGNNYVRLGEVNMQLKEWASASTALQNALDKGDLRDTGYAQLMMGISLFNQEKYSDAKVWLERATAAQNHRATANGFLQLIENEASL